MAEAGRASDQARSPAGAQTTVTDRLGELGRQLTRTTMRTAGTIEQTRQRRSRFLTRRLPTMSPTMGSRRRHAEGGRGRLQGQALLDRADERVSASQSE